VAQTPSSSSKRNTVAVVVVVVILLVVAVAVVISFTPLSGGNVGGGEGSEVTDTTTSQLTTPAYIVLSGSISLSGQGTYATTITFASSGNTYTATVSGGQFSKQLPNPATYTVTVNWQGEYSWQHGTLNEGTYQASQGAGGSGFDSIQVTDETPNSVVSLVGNVQTNGAGTQPISIKFVNSDGQEFPGTVTAGTYSITGVPNLINYTVTIYWTGYFSSSGTCNAGTLPLQAGVGVGTIQSNWNC
jgi:hypothetical protein